ncbi:MAG TPA: hypothetical protein VFU07_10605 [Candidatus Lumbricidophila sp.]|nr:hypothetical protein [Candidatus Lumbricidophila sp.]
MTSPQNERATRRELLRPVEYVGGSLIAAVFVAVIAYFGTHDWLVTLVAAGGVFIVCLVVLALLQLAIKPDAFEAAELGAHGDAGVERDASDGSAEASDPKH